MIGTVARNGVGFSFANEKTYDVWGAVRSDSGAVSGQILNPNTKYCANLGHKYDSGTELTYMRARYYEAATGRFISQDLIRHGQNWYAYCENDPIHAVDPDGKESVSNRANFLLGVFEWVLGSLIGGYSTQITFLTQLTFLLAWCAEQAKGKDHRTAAEKNAEGIALSLPLSALIGTIGAFAQVEMAKTSGRPVMSPAQMIIGIILQYSGFLQIFMSLNNDEESNG